MKERGFNQAMCFAKGLSKELGIPIDDNLIKRKIYSSTQTQKSKFIRWQNVEEVFEIENKNEYTGKHILLVDDVLTTGATLESCYNALKNKEMQF